MTIPYRGTTTASTYFITAGTYLKKPLLQSDGMADLFCETLFRYRDGGRFGMEGISRATRATVLPFPEPTAHR